MKLPDCSPDVLYRIGLALETSLSKGVVSIDQMRKRWGDKTVDWLIQAEKDPEFLGAYPPAGADSKPQHPSPNCEAGYRVECDGSCGSSLCDFHIGAKQKEEPAVGSAPASRPESSWVRVSYPIGSSDALPPERKVVTVWCEGERSRKAYLPYLGYVRYAAGDPESPYFVVYHGNSARPTDVIAWCDCLPDRGPEWTDKAKLYTSQQALGRGFPARPSPTRGETT